MEDTKAPERTEEELTDEVVDRLIEEQRWKDADEADQILEQEALSHGFG